MNKRKNTNNKPFYITTTLPYVNAAPHIGFASELVIADCRARWERTQGKEVVFNTGTDEHGAKIWEKAREEKKDPQQYVNEYAEHFKELAHLLGATITNFVRTTDARHIAAAQELWRRVEKNGFLYKKEYRVKYCTGCEMEKTDSELEDGQCPLHPNKELEIIEEENYFFRLSAFGEKLLALYEKYPDFVVPDYRANEIKRFVERGLTDFSVSRLREKMPWGVPVPGDETQVMSVWFDALTNYISTLGWPDDKKNFIQFWGTSEAPRAVQIAGKDNLRQQSAMWQAMLLAADLPTSRQICINGFISVGGQKMSKSLGNVISPREMVERFGCDGTRYLLLTKSYFGDDADVSMEKFTEKYNADLANGLGNLTSRVQALAQGLHFHSSGDLPQRDSSQVSKEIRAYEARIGKLVEKMEIKQALEIIWKIVEGANKYMEETKPWKMRKKKEEERENTENEFEEVMKHLLSTLASLSQLLAPFLPETADRIAKMLQTGEKEMLFPRVE